MDACFCVNIGFLINLSKSKKHKTWTVTHHFWTLPVALLPICNSRAVPRERAAILLHTLQVQAVHAKEGAGSQTDLGAQELCWVATSDLECVHHTSRYMRKTDPIWLCYCVSQAQSSLVQKASQCSWNHLELAACGQQAWFLKYCQPGNNYAASLPPRLDLNSTSILSLLPLFKIDFSPFSDSPRTEEVPCQCSWQGEGNKARPFSFLIKYPVGNVKTPSGIQSLLGRRWAFWAENPFAFMREVSSSPVKVLL